MNVLQVALAFGFLGFVCYAALGAFVFWLVSS